jgi:hypothetical protein
VLWSQRAHRRKGRAIHAIAIATALLALAVRLYWTVWVQNPLQALYSDMGGYHSRAIDALEGNLQGDPRSYAFFPWGAHVLIAGELALVGRTNAWGVAIVQSIVSTIPAVCVVYLTARVVKARFWVIVAGMTAALWQPSVVHAGFFMSEMWYSAFLVAGTLYLLRFLEGKSGAFGAGLCLGIATVVRPQVLLTFAIVGGAVALAELGRWLFTSRRSKTSIRRWVLFFAPMVAILGFSALRFHELTNRWGLVSENGAINRVFGATHLGRVEAYWNYKGGRYVAWYTPPAKSPVKNEDRIVFEGYIGDEVILDRIRIQHAARETTAQQLRRMHRNTRMLIYRFIFPEDDFAANGKHPNRASLQHIFRLILINILPVSVFGVFAMLMAKRHRLLGFLLAAHAFTLIVVAALYFAEARMRMPYDPFLITAFAAGCSAAYGLMRKSYGFARDLVHRRRAG